MKYIFMARGSSESDEIVGFIIYAIYFVPLGIMGLYCLIHGTYCEIRDRRNQKK